MSADNVVVIIPAFNEENSVGQVIHEIPSDVVREIIVVNNDSTDATADAARKAGATVITEKRRGYGQACLSGIEHAGKLMPPPEVIVFLDADLSDHPSEMRGMLVLMKERGLDMVIGSRALGNRQQGSMTIQQMVGNKIAVWMLKWLYGVRYTDLGPFRAIRFDKLQDLQMQDKTYGWTVEMQLKAAKRKLKVGEIPVSYRRRIGKSKISGTLKGTVMAGYKIITTILKYR